MINSSAWRLLCSGIKTHISCQRMQLSSSFEPLGIRSLLCVQDNALLGDAAMQSIRVLRYEHDILLSAAHRADSAPLHCSISSLQWYWTPGNRDPPR